MHQPLYLLDGQQRLTSLAWVYRPESKADGRLIDLRFGVRTEEFVNPSAVQRKDPLLIRCRRSYKETCSSRSCSRQGCRPTIRTSTHGLSGCSR
jgi:hypothetical protein